MSDPAKLGPDTALVVVDVQAGFDDPAWGPRNNPACDANVAALVAAFAASGRPVVFVRHDSDEPESALRPDGPGNALKPYLADRTPDLLVTKQVNSSFHGEPDLDAWLRGRDITLARGLRHHHQPLLRDDGPRRRQPRVRRVVRPRRDAHLRPHRPRRHHDDRRRAGQGDGDEPPRGVRHRRPDGRAGRDAQWACTTNGAVTTVPSASWNCAQSR